MQDVFQDGKLFRFNHHCTKEKVFSIKISAVNVTKLPSYRNQSIDLQSKSID